MCLDRFQHFLTGATRPFVALSEEGEPWVAKTHGNPLGTKTIFNEYVTGSLAREVKLPWPTTAIVELSPAILQRLKQEGLEVLSPWAVGSRYLPNLKPVLGEWDPKRNPSQIRLFFGDLKKYAGFYGKAVFDNWVLLDDSKYDTLFVTPDESPIFLDASHAFAGAEWNAETLKWSDIRVRSPYLEGILLDRTQFGPWLERIQSVDSVVIKNVFDAIPKEWDVPTGYPSAAAEFVAATQSTFLRAFQSRMDYCYAIENNSLAFFF